MSVALSSFAFCAVLDLYNLSGGDALELSRPLNIFLREYYVKVQTV